MRLAFLPYLFILYAPIFLRLIFGVLKKLPVISRLVTFHKTSFFRQCLARLAFFEYYFSSLREILGLVLMGLWAYKFWFLCTSKPASLHDIKIWLCLTLLLTFEFLARFAKSRTRLLMIEFLRVNPSIHPQDFIWHFSFELAFGLRIFEMDDTIRTVSPNDADFRRQQRPSLRRFAVILGFLDVMQCAKICLTALKFVGPRYLSENADVAGSWLGKRILQRSRAAFRIIGDEKIREMHGKCIFVFNHESCLDFLLAPFALSQIRINGRPAHPRFFVAKEHFYDSFFVYHLLGIGRVIEALDMIFVDRKNRKNGVASLKAAAGFFIRHDVDLAIYPQGARSAPVFDRAGKRRGAGYYTTVTRARALQKLAHLKKGLAHLVIDILQEMSQVNLNEDLHLIFIGIDGAAKVLPKSIWSIETESSIEFRVGDVLTLNPKNLEKIYPHGSSAETALESRKNFVEQLMGHIDQKLSQVLQVQHKLDKRFLMDLKGQFRHFENDKILQIEQAIHDAAIRQEPVYPILDCIYTLPTKEWNGYLAQFCQLLLGKPDPHRFDELLKQVMQRIAK